MTVLDPVTSIGPNVIVHLITTLSQGGAERAISMLVPGHEEAESLGERHIVISLAPGGMFSEILRGRGIEVRDLGMRPGRDLLTGVMRLERELRELQPKHIVAWMYHAMFLADLIMLRRSVDRRPRVTWMVQGSLHSTAGLPWHTRAIIGVLARRSRRIDTIAINSETGRQHHEQHGYRPIRWVMVPSGCDTAVFRPDLEDRATVREELGIDSDAIVAVSVARDHPQKDHATMIAALDGARDSVPELELLLVGTNTEQFSRDEVGEARIRGLGERGDVPRLLRAADLVISSSITEGMPNAILEAMSSGLPAVVTDVGDCRLAVGSTGEVVPPHSVPALRDAVVRIAALPTSERERLGTRARERIVDRFGVEAARVAYRDLWRRTPAGP